MLNGSFVKMNSAALCCLGSRCRHCKNECTRNEFEEIFLLFFLACFKPVSSSALHLFLLPLSNIFKQQNIIGNTLENLRICGISWQLKYNEQPGVITKGRSRKFYYFTEQCKKTLVKHIIKHFKLLFIRLQCIKENLEPCKFTRISVIYVIKDFKLWFIRLQCIKENLEPCTFFRIQVIFPPVRLFHPVHLLIFGKLSTLYVYSILYDYLIVKST